MAKTEPAPHWFWQDDDHTWKPYSQEDSDLLEAISRTGGIETEVMDGKFICNLSNRTQNKNGAFDVISRHIIRGTWFWQDSNRSWQPYPEATAESLESAYFYSTFGEKIRDLGLGSLYVVLEKDGTGKQFHGCSPSQFHKVLRGYQGKSLPVSSVNVSPATSEWSNLKLDRLVGDSDKSHSQPESTILECKFGIWKEGHMSKKSGRVSGWKMRWLVLTSDFLAVYANRTKEKNKIWLGTIQHVDFSRDNRYAGFYWVVYIPSRHYTFRTITKREAISWIEAINYVKNRPKGLNELDFNGTTTSSKVVNVETAIRKENVAVKDMKHLSHDEIFGPPKLSHSSIGVGEKVNMIHHPIMTNSSSDFGSINKSGKGGVVVEKVPENLLLSMVELPNPVYSQRDSFKGGRASSSVVQQPAETVNRLMTVVPSNDHHSNMNLMQDQTALTYSMNSLHITNNRDSFSNVIVGNNQQYSDVELSNINHGGAVVSNQSRYLDDHHPHHSTMSGGDYHSNYGFNGGDGSSNGMKYNNNTSSPYERTNYNNALQPPSSGFGFNSNNPYIRSGDVSNQVNWNGTNNSNSNNDYLHQQPNDVNQFNRVESSLYSNTLDTNKVAMVSPYPTASFSQTNGGFIQNNNNTTTTVLDRGVGYPSGSHYSHSHVVGGGTKPFEQGYSNPNNDNGLVMMNQNVDIYSCPPMPQNNNNNNNAHYCYNNPYLARSALNSGPNAQLYNNPIQYGQQPSNGMNPASTMNQPNYQGNGAHYGYY